MRLAHTSIVSGYIDIGIWVIFVNVVEYFAWRPYLFCVKRR